MGDTTKTSWEAACEWYKPEETYRCIQDDLRKGELKIPRDITSREFADWLTDQYRLAMNRGILNERECV